MRVAALILALVVLVVATGEAVVVKDHQPGPGHSQMERQRRGGGGGFRGGGRGGFMVSPAVPEDFDGSWQFCRGSFRPNRNGDGAGWSVDYPRADINLSIRLSELTKTTVGFNGPEDPKHVILRLSDPTLFQCGFVMLTEIGAAFIDDQEAENLRNYLLKGGFLWGDDFWGEYAWEAWMEQWGKVFPVSQYPVKDIPKDHPMFHAQFEIPNGVPQIASIGYWLGSGGDTSERGRDSAEPHARGVFDANGRLMALFTHNTDLGDSWEEEASNPQYFYQFSTKGYAFGINVLVYSMTH